MPATINSAPPTSTHRQEMDAAFKPGRSITGNSTLAYPAVVGEQIEVNSASAVVLTLPSGSSIRVGTRIEGHNIGAGAVSFAAGGSETIQMDASLPSSVAQWGAFELRRISGNRWLRVA